jgi:hypothetical protein
MQIRSFHACAERFATTWSQGERPIFEGLASSDRRVRLEALQNGAGYFRIARSFHRKFDVGVGVERLAPLLEVLEPFRAVALRPDTVCATVATLRVRLGEDYGGGDRLSAATKLLWLLQRDPAIIYDSQARFALGAPAGDYETYVELWRRGYRNAGPAIREACTALPGRATKSVPFLAGVAPEWFRQRVYDIYLWSAGAAGKRVSTDAVRSSR